jgi:hypothetical protein
MILRSNLPKLREVGGRSARVLDAGGWYRPFNLATHVIDLNPYESRRVDDALDPEDDERFTICQPSETAHAHPHREILTLDIACGNVLRIGIASAAECLCPIDLRWTVPASRMRFIPSRARGADYSPMCKTALAFTIQQPETACHPLTTRKPSCAMDCGSSTIE